MNEMVDGGYAGNASMDDRVGYGEQDGQGIPLGESDSFSNVAQGLTGHHRDLMMQYWQDTINSIEHDDHKFKIHQLPLARIKKVMKADEDVKMISAEAPILFAKGCDVFITELTMRAWIHAEENKRRTLQRSDIASALQKSDMFDFLIDIVPREEALAANRRPPSYQDMYQDAGGIPGYVDEQEMGLQHDEGYGGPNPDISEYQQQQQQQQPQPQPAQSSQQHTPTQTAQSQFIDSTGQSTPTARNTPSQHTPQDYNQVYQHGYNENIDYNGYRQY